MSDDSSRPSTPVWVWLVGLVFIGLLGVNLAMTVFAERVPAVLSAELVQTVAFWGGWGVAAAAALGGWFWAGRALERSDRDSTRRLRACFLVALTAVIVLAIATFEEALDRAQLAAVAAAVLALAIVPFTVAAWALNEGGHRRRRRHRSSDDGR